LNEKNFLIMLVTLLIFLLGGCTEPEVEGNPVTELPSSTEFSANSSTHVDFALNDHHHIQTDVEGGQNTRLDTFVLEPLPVSIEEAVNIFAPEDSGAHTVKDKEEGSLLTTDIIGAYHPIEVSVICFQLEWACCTWLGLLSYCLNNFTETNVGSVVAEGFVLLDIAVYNSWPYFFLSHFPNDSGTAFSVDLQKIDIRS